MRILYGVSGEGFGHSSRARKIIPYLINKGHEILVVSYGQGYKNLKKDFNVLKVEGIELIFKEGKLSLKRTAKEIVYKILKNLKNWERLKEALNKFKPEICISDMEPIVPLIRYWYDLPLICLDNQHRITHLKLNVPREYKKDYYIARLSIKKIVSKADYYVILSFTKSRIKERKKQQGIYIIDPILREEVTKLKTKKENFILVYLTKPNDGILDILERINEKFVVYVYGMKKRAEKKISNLEFKKIGIGFLDDLARCKGIIASSGFSLMSEATYLKKPYYAIPLKGQFEQILNALFLKQAGFGDYSEEPKEKDINKFLKNLNVYEENLEKHKMRPDQVLEVLDKILKKF